MPSSSASTTSSRCAGSCGLALQRQQRHRDGPARQRAACHVDGRAAAAHHHHAPAQRRRRTAAAGRQVAGAVHHPGPARRPAAPGALRTLCTQRDEHRIVRAGQRVQRVGAAQGLAAVQLHAQGNDARDLGVEHAARQPVGRDAVAHHAAQFGAGLVQAHAVAPAAQLVGRRQAGRPAAHDRHMGCTGCMGCTGLRAGAQLCLRLRRRQGPALRQGLVTHVALQPADRQRFVVAAPVAGGFAGVVADAPGDRREGVVAHQREPGAVQVAAARLTDPGGDLAAHRAGLPAGRRCSDVAWRGGAPGAGVDALGGAGGPGGGNGQWCVHGRASCRCAAIACQPARTAAMFSSCRRGACATTVRVSTSRSGPPSACASAPSSAELTMRPSP
jgi:hypothetical protein